VSSFNKVEVRKYDSWRGSSKIILTLLPNPEIIRNASSNIISAFEDTIQVELLKTRWEEIKKLQVQSGPP
jgi:hypothetical protein